MRQNSFYDKAPCATKCRYQPGGKSKKELYTPVHDVVSAATKQREKESQSGFFGKQLLFSYIAQ